MATVEVTLVAQGDLFKILRHLADIGGVATARNYDRSFEELFARAAVYPLLYPLRPSLGRYVRIGLVRSYAVLYRHDEDADVVTVLRILHTRREIDSDFMDLP